MVRSRGDGPALCAFRAETHHFLDKGVDDGAGLDEEHHAAGALEARHHLLDGARANDVGAWRAAGACV